MRARRAAGSAVTSAAGTRTALTPTSAAAPAPTSSQRLPKRRATVAHCATRPRVELVSGSRCPATLRSEAEFLGLAHEGRLAAHGAVLTPRWRATVMVHRGA